jgi:hypothetical protein
MNVHSGSLAERLFYDIKRLACCMGFIALRCHGFIRTFAQASAQNSQRRHKTHSSRYSP